MFSKYFSNYEKKLTKKPKAAPKGGAKGSKSKKAPASGFNDIKEMLNNIVPSNLTVDSLKFIDPSGYCPEGTDLIAYREYCRDFSAVMDGHIPCDLVYGTFHIFDKLDKNNLNTALTNVLQAKKINRYAEAESERPVIPAFIIARDTTIKFPELKNTIVEHYMSKSIDHLFEVDIMAILGNGVVVKDWREKRSFIAIETGKDTMMWFFILMSEYLDVERGSDMDLRFYVNHAQKYNEY